MKNHFLNEEFVEYETRLKYKIYQRIKELISTNDFEERNF